MYENILNFSFPNYDELPELDLYMDQVISLIDMKLSVFFDESGKMATPTMINNYVKQKIVNPPVKKKYGKEHIAQLFIIFILKKVLSVSEIDGLLKGLLINDTTENIYKEFCKHIEYAIKIVFNESEKTLEKISDNENSKIFSAVALAFATKLYAEKIITFNIKEDEKNDKQNKK